MALVTNNNPSVCLANLNQEERNVLYQDVYNSKPEIQRLQITLDTSVARLFQVLKFSPTSPDLIAARTKLRSLRNEYLLKIIQLGLPKEFEGQDLNLCMNSSLLRYAAAIEPLLSASGWEYVAYRLFNLFGSGFHSGNQRMIKEILDYPEIRNGHKQLSLEEQLNWQRVDVLYSAGAAINSIWSKCMSTATAKEPSPRLFLESIRSSGKLFFKSLENLNTRFEAQLVICGQVLNDLKALNKIDYQKQAIKSLETSIETVQAALTSFRRVIKSRLRLFKKRLEAIPILDSYTENQTLLRRSVFELSQIQKLFTKQLSNLFKAVKDSYEVFYRGLPQTIRKEYPELKANLAESSQDYFIQYSKEEKKAHAYQIAYANSETVIQNISISLLAVNDDDKDLGACTLAYFLHQTYSSLELQVQLNEPLDVSPLRTFLRLIIQPPSEAILQLSHLNELLLGTSASEYLKPIFQHLVQLLKNYAQLHRETFFSTCFISQLQINSGCLSEQMEQVFKQCGESPELNLDWLEEEDSQKGLDSSSPPQIPRKRIQQKTEAEKEKIQASETASKKLKSRSKKPSKRSAVDKPLLTYFQRYHQASKSMLQVWKKGYPQINNYIYKDCLRHFRLLGAVRDAMLVSKSPKPIFFTLVRSASLALEKVLKLTSHGSNNPKVFRSHDHILLMNNSSFSEEAREKIRETAGKVRSGAAFVRYPHFYQELLHSHKEEIPETLEWLLNKTPENVDALLSWEEEIMTTAHIALGIHEEVTAATHKIKNTCNSLSKSSQKKLTQLYRTVDSIIQSLKLLKSEDSDEIILKKEIQFHLENLKEVLQGWLDEQDSRLLWVYGEAILTHLQALDELIETLLHYRVEGIVLRPQHDLSEWRELLNQDWDEDEQIICSELNIDWGAHYVHQWLHHYKGKAEDLPMAISWRLDAERLCRYSEDYAEGFIPSDEKPIPDPMELSERLLHLVEIVLRSARKRLA